MRDTDSHENRDSRPQDVAPATGIPTPAEIFEIARRNPCVYQATQMFLTGRCSWEQAMMIAVLQQHLEKQSLLATLDGVIARMPPDPIVIPKSQSDPNVAGKPNGNT